MRSGKVFAATLVVAMVASSVAAQDATTPPTAAPAKPAPAIPGDRILTQSPSPRALTLGRELAESGTLASLLPLLIAKDTAELVAEYKDLTPAETTRLGALSAEVAAAGSERLFAAQARAYAMRLSEADLTVLAAATRDPAQARFRAALPGAIAATMAGVGELDLKKDIRAAFCKETGKGCGR